MGYDPDRHHRRSIRYRGWDYSSAGAYFVTLVTHDRICWFENDARRVIVEQEWANLPGRFPTVVLDDCVVMPNHVHFIIWLNPVGAQFDCAPDNAPSADPTSTPDNAPSDALSHAPPDAQSTATPSISTNPPNSSPIGRRFEVDRERPTLGQVLRAFKAVISRRIRQAGGEGEGFAWQRNYYERIIRNERELIATRQYIYDNPAHWENDSENPAHGR